MITWKRIDEIVGFPTFTDHGKPFVSPIEQGEIGDSWFLNSLLLLSSHKEFIFGEENQIFSGIYPQIFHFLRYWGNCFLIQFFKKIIGIYVFRFFKDFKWVYVIIDDRIPCVEVTKGIFSPIFAGNENRHEFWVALIEKAYAKLHYSYQSLESGHLNVALKDMTGNFVANLSSKYAKPDEYFAAILDFLKRGALISCANWGETEKMKENYEKITGLQNNFAYRLLKAFEIPDPNCKNLHKSHRLCLIQNPGMHEKIEGAWGLNSQKFKEFAAKIKENHIEITENTFLLRFKNFRTFYNEIFAVCQPSNEARMYYLFDEWVKSTSGGLPMPPTDQKAVKNWAKNPKYFFQINRKVIEEKTRFFLELSQPDPRLMKKSFFPFGDEMNSLCFMVMKHENMKIRKIEKYE